MRQKNLKKSNGIDPFAECYIEGRMVQIVDVCAVTSKYASVEVHNVIVRKK